MKNTKNPQTELSNSANEITHNIGQLNHIFPRAVLTASREEFGNLEDNPHAKHPPLSLRFTEDSRLKQLPSNIQGYMYMVGPVGSIDSPRTKPDSPVVDPTQDGTILLYNGDGMIYCLDFERPKEGAVLSSRLSKPPSYYADVATYVCPQYKKLRFESVGITRVSEALGVRNQLNTAFLPMKFSPEERTRLLITWDMGRPYEIDPKNLETVTPMGWNHEWEPATAIQNLPGEPPPPFKAIQSSAHPYITPEGLLFTTNIKRSVSNIFSQIIPVIYVFKELGEDLWEKCFKGKHSQRIEATDVVNKSKSQSESQAKTSEQSVKTSIPKQETLPEKLGKILIALIQFVRGIINFFTGNLVELVVWDGKGKLQKWGIYYNNRPIRIFETTHQIGVTEDYVIIIDTAFKISIEELLPSLKLRKDERIEKWIRNFLDHPQFANNRTYIISRKDLKPENQKVEARKLLIPYESAHFLVNYKNPKGKITIHFSHVCAWDAGETVSRFDYLKPSPVKPTPNLPPLYGVLYGPTDISRLSYHIIDGEKAKVIKKDILMDTNLTWGPAIWAYHYGPNYLTTPYILEDIYWICLGCWQELLLPHIIELYQDYQYRQIALELMKKITKQGRKSNLLHLHIDYLEDEPSCMSIVDSYEFPNGYYVLTPQFIPSRNSSGQTDGYVVCLVQYGDGKEETNGNEVWIFDGKNLKDGPICQLWHPKLNFGFTVHSTWLQKAERRTADYNIPVKEDYEQVVKQQSAEVQALFEKWVYPQQEPTGADNCVGD